MAAVATSAGRTASSGGSPPRRSGPRRGGRGGGAPWRRSREAIAVDWEWLPAAMALSTGLVLLGVGVCLVARRTAGAFPAPDPADGHGVVAIATPLACGMLVLLVDAIARAAAPGWPQAAAAWIARLGLALVLAAVLPPPVAALGLVGASRPIERAGVMAAAVFAVATLIAPLVRSREAHGRRSSPRFSPPSPRRPATLPAVPPSAPVEPGEAPLGPRPTTDSAPGFPSSDPLPAAAGPADAAALHWPPLGPEGSIQQRFERVLLADERVDCLRGTIHLSVLAGARSATGHVGFCPPFPALPQVEVGTRSEAVEAAIVAAEILPWGVRVECRLDEPADETILIPVDVVARAPLGAPEDAASAPPSPHPRS